jgi:hypothetical protein
MGLNAEPGTELPKELLAPLLTAVENWLLTLPKYSKCHLRKY